MARSLTAFAMTLLVAISARAQLVPITLDCSGLVASADPQGAFPGVTPGTAFSIKYDLTMDISAPFIDDSTTTAWNASGTVTLTIDGLAPIVINASCPVQYLYSPFGDDYDMVRFVANIPGGGFRIISLRTDVGDHPLDPALPPYAALINALPLARQSSNSLAYAEQNSSGGVDLNGSVTAFDASGGAPPPPPVIVTQPAGEIVDAGDVHNFVVIAEGDDLNYQWLRDGVPLTDGPGVAGANARRLRITALESARYECVVSNPGGSVTTHPAILAVENNCPADQNGDGALTPADFTAWIANYNLGC